MPPPGEGGALARLPELPIDWEKWIGVRGAAVLGGVILALAGLFFFRYSIEHGLIPPWLRVVLGTLAGIGCIAASEWTLRRRYESAANAVAGAGIVLLYAAFWAARQRYGLIGTEAAFALMILVTAAGCVISWRHASLVVAVLGLTGGFLTPLMLSTGKDNPIGLFAYLLLLDVGLLELARRRNWPLLSVLSLGATFLYQTAWIVARMGPERALLGLAILAVFAVLFALFALRVEPAERRRFITAQAGGVLLPFALALHFAGNARLGVSPVPIGGLLVILSAAAGWLARQHDRFWISTAAASGSVAVVGLWMLTHSLAGSTAWQAAGLIVLMAAVFHGFAEWQPARAKADGPAPAAIVASLGGLAATHLGQALNGDAGQPWAWIVAWCALAALTVRHAVLPGRHALHAVAAVLLEAALGSLLHRPRADAESVLAVMVAAAVAFLVVALFVASEPGRAWSRHGAAAAGVVALLALSDGAASLSSMIFLGAATLLGFLVALAATDLPSGIWYAVGTGATALVHSAFTFSPGPGFPPLEKGAAGGDFPIQLASALLFTAWPFLAGRRFVAERVAWRAAALAAPAWFLSLRELWEAGWGDDFIGALPLVLGAASLAAAARARDLWDAAEAIRKSTLVWFLAAAFAFVTVAIPLQLEKAWITVGWALEALAVTVLWRRMDHPGLKYFGLALLAAVTVRLIANEAVLGYYPRSGWRIVNWLAYTYLIPAAAMAGMARVLHPDEVGRLRDWEKSVYVRERPLGAIASGVAAIVVVFVWVNLAIADWFSTGATLRVDLARMPARDLTTSIAWALCAIGLLALGVRLANRGLRWMSLALMMVTIVKVFLYDLGQLQDLYRVASLVGLALSLIVVSLAYQRFVLERREGP